MTIDEAIKHCEDIAKSQDMCAEISVSQHAKERISNCAADHRQLAEWLTDYKELKNSIGAVKLELLKGAQAELEKRGNMLHDAIAELEEAKRLLKMAVDDLNKMPCNNDTERPESCYICEKHGNCNYSDSFKWCYADRAEKILKGE